MLINKKTLILLTVIGLLLLVDVVYLNYRILNNSEPTLPNNEFTEPVTNDNCPLSCQEQINKLAVPTVVNNRISPSAITVSPTPYPTIRPTIAKTAISPTRQVNIAYIPLIGGSTAVSGWTKIEGSEFVFDLNSYSVSAIVSWEVNLKVTDANSGCAARLYDLTNLRAVDQSEQNTGETSFKYIKSSPLSIWRGNNHYQVELKSLNGSVCSLGSPRLIITY